MPQLEKYNLKVKLNKDILMLVMLSVKYKLDLEFLLVMYEEMRTDIFFFFYLFSGQKMNFPPFATINKLNDMSEELIDNNFETADDSLKILLDQIYNKDTGDIKIEANVTNEKYLRALKQENKKAKLSIRKFRKNNGLDTGSNTEEEPS